MTVNTGNPLMGALLFPVGCRLLDFDLPPWLDSVLKQALHPQPMKRHEAMSAVVHDLEHPSTHHLRAQRVSPIERNPVPVWRGLLIVLIVVIVALVVRINGAA